MTAGSRQVAEYASLRSAGATAFEAAQILLAVGETERARAYTELRLAGASAAEAACVIDLVSGAWEHELRGKGGRWTRTASPAADAARERLSARMSDQVTFPGSTKKAASNEALAHVHTQAIAAAEEAAAHHAKAEVAKLMAEVKYNHEQFVKQQDTQEGHKAKLKFAGVIGSLVSGGILAYVEAKMGVPDIAQIASSISPAMAESLFELKKRL